MADKEMTLKMKIEATAKQAELELKKVGVAFSHLKDNMANLGKFGKGSLDFGLRGIEALTKPLRLGFEGATVLGAGFVGLATKALVARSGIEQLETRLRGATGSAEGAAEAMAEIESLQGKRLFDDESLVSAKIQLVNMGVAAEGAMQSIVDVAAGTGDSIDGVLTAITQMSDRGLKKMGIDVDKNGEQVVFKYADKMGKLQKVTAATESAARSSLMNIFNQKFGGSASSQMSNTLFGGWRNLSEGVDDAFKAFGKGLSPAVLAFMNSLSSGLQKWADSGKLEAIGKRVGDVLSNAVDFAGVMFKDSETARTGLNGLMKFAAEAFGIYLVLLKDVFVGLATIMVGAFGEQILQLPGMGFLRRTMYAKKIGAGFIETPSESRRIDEGFGRLSPEAQATLLTGGSKRGAEMIQQGISGLGSGIQAAGGSLEASWNKNMAPIINIYNPTFRAPEVRQLQNELQTKAGVPAFSPAGT